MHGGAKDFSKEASANAKKRFFKSFLTLCCCHAEMLLFSISVSYCHSATLSLPSASTCFSISSFLSCWKTFSPELVSGLFQDCYFLLCCTPFLAENEWSESRE